MSSARPRSGRIDVRPLEAWQRGTYRLLRAVLEGLCRVFWRLSVDGRERLPTAGAFVVAPVHRSNVDFAIVGASLPRVLRFMAKDSLWTFAPAGRFFELMGSFPVHREGSDRAALRACEEALALGDPVVMFPEGRRKEGDEVLDLLEGAAFVACRNRVPLVPVGLGNTDRAMPIGARLFRPVKVRVVIGEPIYPDVPLSGRVPRSAVAATNVELRRRIQALYDDARS